MTPSAVILRFRERLDAWLHQNEVDVCRLFAVFYFCCAVGGLYAMVESFAYGRLSLNLTVVFWFFMGSSFKNRKPWRKLAIGLSWFGVVACTLLVPMVHIFGSSGDWTVGHIKMEEPPAWLHVMLFIQGMFFLFLCLFSLFLLDSQKIREEIAMPLEAASQPVSRMNKRLRRIMIAVTAVFLVGESLLPFVTDLKKYETPPDFWPVSTMSCGTNIHLRVNQSLIVYQGSSMSWSSRSKRGCHLQISGYPEFRVEKHKKYTLENGVIREEPWQDTEDSRLIEQTTMGEPDE